MNTTQTYLVAQAEAAAPAETQAIVEANGGATAPSQAAQPRPAGGFGSMWILIPLFGIMYFLMIRPQRKRQKEMQAMQDTLKVGDKVMTANGSIGNVSKVGEKTVWISYSGKIEIEYVRNAIVEVMKDPAPVANTASK